MFIDEIIKYLSLESDEEILEYVRKRKGELDSTTTFQKYIGSNEYAINGWINSKSILYPSSYRSKGFTLDSLQLYVDWIKIIKYLFQLTPSDKLIDIKSDQDKIASCSEKIIEQAIYFILKEFGTQCDNAHRSDIFKHIGLGVSLDVANSNPVNVDEMKGENITRCHEKSAILNNLANFMGIKSSLVCGEANCNGISTGHAWCVIDNGYYYCLCEPSFLLTTKDGYSIPCVAGVSKETLKSGKINVDFAMCYTGEEDLLEDDQPRIIYNFNAEIIQSPVEKSEASLDER